MPHFLIKNNQIKNDIINIDDDNFFHIVKVLRAKINEEIKFIDENRVVYLSKIIEINKKSLSAQIISSNNSDRFLKNNICLIQSILASDAQNLAIANATQTGVKKIYPVISDNTSVSKKALNDKVSKWQKIALENFKQCERADLAQVCEISSLKEALSKFKKENVLIFAEKYATYDIQKSVENIDKNEEITVVIGPEGGFSDSEFEYFKHENYKLITLGKMIYKAPNAIVAGISNIISRIEDV